MYKHILVAFDGSDTSNLALNEAVKLAAALQAQLRIVHVVDAAMFFDWNADFVDVIELDENLMETGRQFLKGAALAATQGGVDAETKLLKTENFSERVAELIIQEALDWPAGLVVLGTHGRRGLSHMMLGSVADTVVRLSKVPVLLIRSP